MLDISFVIIEYDSLEDVKDCINSIKSKCIGLDYEIIVSSNTVYASRFQNIIKEKYPDVNWIFNKSNFGFAKGMNCGLSNAKGRIITIINPDVKIISNNIKSAVKYLFDNPSVALLGPKILDSSANIQDTCRSFMNPIDLISRVLQRIFFRKDVLIDSNFNYSITTTVDCVIGAFMMVQVQAYKNVGGLDEKYFLYVEDMDWCKRFWDFGYKVIYYPHLEVQYKGDRKSISALLSNRFLNKYLFYHIKSYFRFISKHGLNPKRRKV